MSELRPYQVECVKAVEESLRDHASTLYVMATGLGKTQIFVDLAGKYLKRGRVMIVAHRLELVEQAANRVEQMLGIRPEIEMGDKWAEEEGGFFREPCPIVVTSIQSQVSGSRGGMRMARFKPEDFSLIICDESHHSVSSSWRTMLDHYKQNPNLKILGCTATPDRADEEALGQIYEDVAFEWGIEDGIAGGWLVPIRQRMVYVKSLDFSKVRTTAGDLNGKDLDAVMQFEENLHAIATPTLELAKDKKVLVFAASVIHAERLCEIFNRHHDGMAGFVCGTTPLEVRAETFAKYKDNRHRILVNVGVCTEGWDEPTVDCVVMARPTKSRALYTQMIGRGTRVLPGLIDGLPMADMRVEAIARSAKPCVDVLDFVGNAGRHKLVHCVDVLGGKESPRVLEEAEKIIRKNPNAEPMGVQEAIEQAKKQLEREELNRREAAKRAMVKAEASYSVRDNSPFDVFDMEPVKERGWDAGKTLTTKQLAVLEKQGIDVTGMPYSQAKQLMLEVFRRFDGNLASFKQAKWLKKNGYNPEMTRAEASAIMDTWAKNGWRRPPEPPKATGTEDKAPW